MSAAVGALLVGSAPSLLAPREPDILTLGWDFAQHTAAARLLVSGQPSAPFDRAALNAEWLALVQPERPVEFPEGNAFLSPPTLPLVYAPFALLPLPYRGLELLHRLLSFAAFGWAMYLLRRWLPVHWLLAAVLGLASPWSLTNVVTGQATYLLVLVWAVAARLVAARRPNAAALALGVGLLLKPQLVWLGLPLVAMRGGWRGALAAGGALYLGSAVLTWDPLWPTWWLKRATEVAVGQPDGLSYGPLNIALAAVSCVPWLVGPREWRGQALLVAIVGVLALPPYTMHYYYLLGLLPFWVLLGAGLRLLRRAVLGGRERLERVHPSLARRPQPAAPR